MTHKPIPPENQVPEIVKQFEPARAVLRPYACDGRAGCWVKDGVVQSNFDNRSPRCTACNGKILATGWTRAHAKALVRCVMSAP